VVFTVVSLVQPPMISNAQSERQNESSPSTGWKETYFIMEVWTDDWE